MSLILSSQHSTNGETMTADQVFQKTSAFSLDEDNKAATPMSANGGFFESHELNNYDGASFKSEQEREAFKSMITVRVERCIA